MSDDATLDEFVESDTESQNQTWEERQLRELVKQLQAGGTPNTDRDEYYGGEIPWVKTGELGQLKIESTQQSITEQGLEESTARLFPEKTVLIAMYGATTGEVSILDTEAATNQACCGIIPNNHLTPYYLYYQLVNGKPQLESLSAGSGQQNISKSILEKYRIPVAPLSEQRKIATVLHTVDQAIQKTEEIIEQYDRIKKGLSQDLLNTGTRNHEFVETDSHYGKLPEDWSLERLVDVTEIVGRTEPPTDVNKYWDGTIPWATPDDIRRLNSPTISQTEQTVTQTALEEVSSNLVPPGSVLLTTRATVGLCAVNEVEMTTSRAFKNLIPGDKLDTWYLYYRMSTMEDYLNRLGWGSTFTEVIKPVLENVSIPIPDLEEQKEIGEKLRSIDRAITENIRLKNQYQRLKQGLMQDLLSGTVRTTDTNIEVPEEIAQYG